MTGLFTRNLGLKFVSVLLAGALWIFVQTQHDSEVAYFVSLELEGLPENLVITNEVPATVSIRIAGPRAQQTMLTPRKLALSVDLGDIQPGVSSYEISREQLSLPTGLTLMQISPERLRVEVENLVTKEVPVEWTTRGEVPPGYRLDRQASSITPERVTISVAESEAAGLRRIETRPVDLDGLRGDLRERVFLDRGDHRIRSVRPETVVLSLAIEEVVIKKNLTALPVEVRGIAEGAEVVVEPALVRAIVQGHFSDVDPMGELAVQVALDIADLGSGEHSLTPTVRLPDGVELLDLDPAQVRVLISAAPVSTEDPAISLPDSPDP